MHEELCPVGSISIICNVTLVRVLRWFVNNVQLGYIMYPGRRWRLINPSPAVYNVRVLPFIDYVGVERFSGGSILSARPTDLRKHDVTKIRCEIDNGDDVLRVQLATKYLCKKTQL